MSSMDWWLAITIHGPGPTLEAPVIASRQKGWARYIPTPQTAPATRAATRRSGSHGEASAWSGTATTKVSNVKTPNTTRFTSPMQRRSTRESISGRVNVRAAIAAIVAFLGCLPGQSHAIDATVWAELARVQVLEASFDQTQTRAVLKQPLTSTGRVRFERVGPELKWEVTAPGRSTFSLIGSVARMEYPDLGMNESFDLAQVPDASRLASSLLVWMQADAAAVARDFDTSYGADSAVLTPKDPTLRGLLSTIEVRFVPGPWRVRAVDLVEPDGDRVNILFRGVKLDGVAMGDGA